MVCITETTSYLIGETQRRNKWITPEMRTALVNYFVYRLFFKPTQSLTHSWTYEAMFILVKWFNADKCSCPNCTQESEHSFSRVQKGALLICPHCNKVFQTNLKAVAWLILLVTSIFYILIIYLKQIIKNPPERVWDCGAFCGSHPLTHFVLPCQQLASAVKLFMQQTCTSPQWLAYFSWLRFCQIC